ncbi:hypothetical protein LCGC14_1060580 [marine sediment metagenome]|uniref:Uncharacterized protein n=1 Tax=marine sediment metagenome TaxID=412755 RepID=A0A0F9MQT7_9ZZZZ
MNKKGQMDMMSTIIGIFMLVIVGVVLMTTSAQLVGDTTNTQAAANASFTGANATTTNIQGKFWSDLVVYNVTNDQIIGSGNYTLTNNVVVDGEETARLEKHAPLALQAGHTWLISGTIQPTTYISGSGGRAIANLIVIFFAIAIMIVALTPTLKNKFLDNIGK